MFLFKDACFELLFNIISFSEFRLFHKAGPIFSVLTACSLIQYFFKRIVLLIKFIV